MQITDISIKPVSADGKLKAVASVTFDGVFAVHDIKIIQGQEKLFTAMPTRKMPDGTFKDIVHPVNQEMRALLEQTILEKYRETQTEK